MEAGGGRRGSSDRGPRPRRSGGRRPGRPPGTRAGPPRSPPSAEQQRLGREPEPDRITGRAQRPIVIVSPVWVMPRRSAATAPRTVVGRRWPTGFSQVGAEAGRAGPSDPRGSTRAGRPTRPEGQGRRRRGGPAAVRRRLAGPLPVCGVPRRVRRARFDAPTESPERGRLLPDAEPGSREHHEVRDLGLRGYRDCHARTRSSGPQCAVSGRSSATPQRETATSGVSGTVPGTASMSRTKASYS
ncbi:hypothetical protein ABID95_002696 [Streptomyces atratus]